jgi:hypothetical protein
MLELGFRMAKTLTFGRKLHPNNDTRFDMFAVDYRTHFDMSAGDLIGFEGENTSR